MVASQPESNGVKLMRKGTHACRECRRRKVKCIYPDEEYTKVCQECSEHGRTCVKQGTVRNTQNVSSSRRVRLKVARLESAVQRIAREGSAISHNTDQASIEQTVFHGGEKELKSPDQQLETHNPLFQLFSNEFFFQNGTGLTVAPDLPNLVGFTETTQSDKDKLFNAIAGFTNINGVLRNAGDWWISWRDQHFALKEAASQRTLQEFVHQKLTEESPILVSIGLLTIAMALQQMGREADNSGWSFALTPQQLMEKISTTVDHVVLDNPAYMDDPSIVLLYMLRARQHAENNQLRRSWLRIKEAIRIAREVGLGSELSVGNSTIEGSLPEQQRFIGAIMEIFAFMSMFLGFPHAKDPNFTDARAFKVLLGSTSDSGLKVRALRRVTAIAATRINERNASQDLSDKTTKSIQSSLELAATSMPPGWWDYTSHPTADSILQRHEDLTVQMWYWNVQTFLYLPYLMENPGTPSTMRFRQHCLDACRNLVHLFNYLRVQPSLSVYVCNCDDFQGLLGGCILMIGLLQKLAEESPGTTVSCAFNQDMQLIDELKEIFRYRLFQHGGVIYEQGLKVLDELTRYACGDNDEEEGLSPDTQTIMLPYFGSINIQLVKKFPKATEYTPPSEAASISWQPDIGKDPIVLPSTTNEMNGSSLTSEFVSSDWSSSSAKIPVNSGFESLPPIDWEAWDRFIVNQELGQDWNPGLTFDMDVPFSQ